MADAEAEGIREAGLEVDMYQYGSSVPVPLSPFPFPPHEFTVLRFCPFTSQSIIPTYPIITSIGRDAYE